ncbi:molecular chaperone DnaJ [Achromobacter sp. LC458]|uniref:hypothetical protein n=1 Tax=Achromobacter sp. LC458 TaxID=1120623 RepID=UPI00062A233F|nr:hypothetical protein [Achromobacter sp. LC458]TRM50518.1 molecular chaperone DnaJ [Achromobacter sp. LC458]
MGQHSLETPRQLFERLQARLETERGRLDQWQAVEAEYQRKYTEGLAPLEKKLHELRMKLVLCFDHAHKNMGLSKAEREFVSELVTEFSAELLLLDAKGELPAGCDADKLKTLYKKHSGLDYDEAAADESEDAKAELIEALELDPDTDLSTFTPTQLLRIIQDQFEDDEAEDLLALARAALRNTTPNAVAWQAMQDEEAARRKLGTPDLTPLADVPDGGLPQANATLQAQLDEVLHQASYAEEGFKLRYDLDPFASFDPETVLEELDDDIVDIQEYIGELEHEVMQFSDQALLKAWLKAMRREVEAIERREGRG